MKLQLIVLSVVVTLIYASPLKHVRTSKENVDIDQRYILMDDAMGKIHLVDLKAEPRSRKATVDDVTFYFYRRENIYEADIIPASDFQFVADSHFDRNLKTIFIIHGWNNDQSSDVNSLIKSAILSQFDMNVFVVNWGGLAHTIDYPGARKNSLLVGEYVGDCIKQLMTIFNYSPDNIYMAGHSLGAHACGIAGAKLNGQIHTIIGMDAAKPLFVYDDLEKRLDPSDAQFVHVIHTNGGLLAFYEPIGHADYYPNGGKKQPGCIFDVIGTCAHSRSYQYFAESIYSSGFIAYECDNYDDFQDGLCYGNKKSTLGTLQVDRSVAGKFYLKTNSKLPYAQG